MFKRVAYDCIIDRRNEIDLKNTGEGRKKFFWQKKKENISLKFTRFGLSESSKYSPKGRTYGRVGDSLSIFVGVP